MKAVITGISGQDGAYLAQTLIDQGTCVIGLIRNQKSPLFGLKYLKVDKEVELVELDLANTDATSEFIKNTKPDVIYNLAAQSSVAKSFQNPHTTILFNLHSTLNILEAIRMYSPDTRLYQATSSEMYGAVSELPICEHTFLNPQSPYAISKSSCHYLVRNYREAYQLHASSGILFNHESVLRRENFFIMKVIKSALDILHGKKEYLEVGNIEIRRDFGFAPDYVKAMVKMAQMDQADDYIICSGESISLKEIIHHLFNYLNIDQGRVKINKSLFRPAEIQDIYGDNSKAKEKLGWVYSRKFTAVIEDIFLEYQKNFYRA